jgi:hypothetical protein
MLILGITLPAVGLLVRALLNGYGIATLVLLALAALSWPAVLLLALRRRRAAATSIAWAMGIIGLYLFSGAQMLEWGVLGVVAAISITVSPDGRQAIAEFGRARSFMFATGIVLLAPALASEWAKAGDFSWSIQLPAWTDAPIKAATIGGLVLVSATIFRFDTPARRRASILVAWPTAAIAVSLFQAGLVSIEPQETETFVSAAVPVCLLILAFAVDRLAARRRARPLVSGTVS